MPLIKIKQQDLLRDGKNISDSIAYFTRVYMICFNNISKHIAVSTYSANVFLLPNLKEQQISGRSLLTVS